MIEDAITAKIFCQTYQQILQYLNISEANMEKGEMRCEANISLQKKGSWERNDKGSLSGKNGKKLNPKVEIKNINSFKSLEKAINYEIKRQSELLDKGEKVLAETRGCSDNTGETFSQRIKESSADYRYFPEPDILPIKTSSHLIDELKKQIIELPHKKRERFVKQYNISPDMAEVLTNDKDTANWFEMVISELREWTGAIGQSWENQEIKLAKMTANWISGELFKLLNESKTKIRALKITAENFAELISLVYQEKINSSSGQKILKIIFENGGDPSNIMDKLGLEQKNEENSVELQEIIKKIIVENNEQFQEYKNGKSALLQFLIGKVMAESHGKYNPKKIIEIINSL
jgi:aspartyl-tRNA(Asn)/glutamyl-tRNA(Gln) amidotransferase subunit B